MQLTILLFGKNWVSRMSSRGELSSGCSSPKIKNGFATEYCLI